MDLTRSLGTFDPAQFRDKIHVIGVGATGSHVVENLVLNGIPGNQIYVYDFDKVEEHNIANQLYHVGHVGMYKVDALKLLIQGAYGETINVSRDRVESAVKMKGLIFLLIDGDRKPLFETMKYQPSIVQLIETGLTTRLWRVNIFSPSNLGHVKYFEKTYLTDEDGDASEVSVCGSRQVISNTAKSLAANAVWSFMLWVNDDSRTGIETMFSFDPFFALETKMELK